MTISSSVGRQRTIGEVITNAFRHAGLIEIHAEPDAAQMRYGQQCLQNTIDRLSGNGVIARFVDFINLSLVSGTYRYDLPARVIDLAGDGMFIDNAETDLTQAGGELPVYRQSKEEWHKLSAKDATGTPRYAMVMRVVDVTAVWLWPVPDETGTIRFPVEVKPADADLTTSTLDLDNYWVGYITADVARQLAEASSLPGDKVGRLYSEAGQEYETALGKASDALPSNPNVSHRTVWN